MQIKLTTWTGNKYRCLNQKKYLFCLLTALEHLQGCWGSVVQTHLISSYQDVCNNKRHSIQNFHGNSQLYDFSWVWHGDTHSASKFCIDPSVEGMLPLSWLLSKSLLKSFHMKVLKLFSVFWVFCTSIGLLEKLNPSFPIKYRKK